MGRKPPAPRAAATVIIVRDTEDGEAIEVLMAERHSNLSFAGGALVFPGGLLEEGDSSPDLRDHCMSLETIESEQLVHRLAAIRETFEETGLLFAFDSEGWSIGETRRAAFAAEYQMPLRAGELTFVDFVVKEKLQFAPDDLFHFAHWITPEMSPQRYDTHFYLATEPEGQHTSCDGQETVDTTWARPRDVIDEARQGRVGLMFPTRLNLEVLAPCRSVQQALKLTRQRPIVPVLPEIFEKNGETWARIPSEAGYGVSEARRIDLDIELGSR